MSMSFHEEGWVVCRNVNTHFEERYGPVSRAIIEAWIAEKRIVESDFIWAPGADRWMTMQEVVKAIAVAPGLGEGGAAAALDETISAPENTAANEDELVATLTDAQTKGPFPREASNRDVARVRGQIKSLRELGGTIESDAVDGVVSFRLRDFTANKCASRLLLDAEVEFDVVPTAQGYEARRIRGIKYRAVTDDDRSPSGLRIHEWAKIIFNKPHSHDGERYDNVLHALSKIAQKEMWNVGSSENDRKFPFLSSYLSSTFVRSASQGKIAIKAIGRQHWAVFNTGLVDKVFDPIYMLFEGDERWVWRFAHFAVPPKGHEGRRLIQIFDLHELPRSATYFDSGDEVIMILKRPEVGIPFREDHIIEHAIEQDRYPPEFLERYRPKGLKWVDYTGGSRSDRAKFLENYANRLRSDNDARVEFKRAIEKAIEVAQRRTTWNYKTAIPAYYPVTDKMQLLLPLSLDSRDEKKVSAALIVNRHASGAYEGTTIYPLEWAYRHARVVCRPDSDWLKPEAISVREVDSEDGSAEQDDD